MVANRLTGACDWRSRSIDLCDQQPAGFQVVRPVEVWLWTFLTSTFPDLRRPIDLRATEGLFVKEQDIRPKQIRDRVLAAGSARTEPFFADAPRVALACPVRVHLCRAFANQATEASV